MADAITFDVLVRDRASAQFDKIARSTSTLESRFAKFTATARNVATTLVGVQVGKSVLEAADKFETSRSRLETITQNIGSNFEALSKQVDAADAHMEKFGFTNAQTEGALASLESATKDPAKALRDLALAADLARGRNISLEEATALLMKVETGHVALLARYGIASKDAAGHTLSSAQALQMLSQLYGGAASRNAETLVGKQQAVSAAMQDSAAKIGVALLPAALDLAKVLQHDVLPPLQASAQWLDRNRTVIEPLVAVIGGAVLAWKTYSFMTGLAAEANLAFAASTATVDAALTAEAVTAARTKLLGPAALFAGGAAIYEGSKTRGDKSRVLTDTGTGIFAGAGIGAAVGAVGGPVGAAGGALLGAAGGLSYSLTTNTLHDFFGDPSKKGKGTAQFGADFQKQVDALGGVDKALAFYKTQNAAAAASAKNFAGQIDAVSTAAQRSATAIINSAKTHINLTGAQDALRQAFQQAAQTAADNGRALTGNSDAALANRDAVRQEANAVLGVIDAMNAAKRPPQEVANMLAVLTQAVETNAAQTYGNRDAVHALLLQLGLVPDAVSAASLALASLNQAQQALLNSDTPSKGAIQQLNAGIAKAKVQGQKVADSFTSGYTPVVSKAAEAAAKKASTAVADAFKAAKDKMLSDVDTIRQTITSTQQQILGFADFSTHGTDALGASGLNTDVRGQLQANVAKLKTFATLFTQLDRLHLDPHLMAQFAAAGPDAIPAMQALVHQGARGIKAVNALERQAIRYSADVGRVTAKEQDANLIHQDLLKLPGKLEKPFANALKNLHLSVSLKESDWKQGKGVLVSP